jgi:hypothetical protein
MTTIQYKKRVEISNDLGNPLTIRENVERPGYVVICDAGVNDGKSAAKR